jgi:CMP-N-acetylneuraminic acid synthetase
MEVLALITARGKSKGIPGKNLALLGGKPLMAWSIEAAHQSPSLSQVVVSTDDPGIAAVCRDHGGSVPFLPRGTCR